MSHYSDIIMGTVASQITSLTIVYSTVYSDADQRKHQSFASLAFVRGIHRGPVNSPHKWPVTWKMFPFDDVVMTMALSNICPWHWHIEAIFNKETSNIPLTGGCIIMPILSLWQSAVLPVTTKMVYWQLSVSVSHWGTVSIWRRCFTSISIGKIRRSFTNVISL